MSTSDTPEEIELDCLTCNRLVLARVLSSVIPEYDLDPARYNLDGQNSCTAFKVAYCPRCESVAFVESSWTGYGGEFASDPEHVVRYPRDREPLSDDVPESIRRTFEQALKCYRVHAHDASALISYLAVPVMKKFGNSMGNSRSDFILLCPIVNLLTRGSDMT